MHSLFYRHKTGNKSVNIFHKPIYDIISSPPTPCRTYCLALQNNGFCVAKAALLHRKTAVFAMAKRSHRFSTELSLQSLCRHSNH